MLPERDCSKCDADRKRVWGCSAKAEVPVRIGDEEFWRCPRRPVLDSPHEFAYWLRLYRYKRQGLLPEPGSVLEQCATTLQVFDILDRTYGEVEEYRAAQANKGSGGGDGGKPPPRKVLAGR